MGLDNDIQAASERISNADSVTVASHIDADGITSGAILRQGIQNARITVKSIFLRQLEPMQMKKIPDDDSLKVFIDFGAGQQNLLEEHGLREEEVLIIDHHVSQNVETPYLQVNSLPYGHEKLSAAGLGYMVMKEMGVASGELAKLAVVGNVGDMMAREHCGLIGPAREIVDDGVSFGSVKVVKYDLNCYGISTRPVHTCLSYCDDPYIPGITNNIQGAQEFLEKLGITSRTDDGQWRVWEEIKHDERRCIISALTQQLIANGEGTERLLSETYLFPEENRRTPLRNAPEYATMLNACGRWARADIGCKVCCNDRGIAYSEAEKMLQNHKNVIRQMMEYILDTGVTELSHLQYLHVGNRFPDTIVGIGAGMALSKLNWRKPIMILCYLPDDPELIKVSMRTNDRMIKEGIDLQSALLTASQEVGGEGGGHKIAAGAYIPKSAEKEFASRVNRILEEQSA